MRSFHGVDLPTREELGGDPELLAPVSLYSGELNKQPLGMNVVFLRIDESEAGTDASLRIGKHKVSDLATAIFSYALQYSVDCDGRRWGRLVDVSLLWVNEKQSLPPSVYRATHRDWVLQNSLWMWTACADIGYIDRTPIDTFSYVPPKWRQRPTAHAEELAVHLTKLAAGYNGKRVVTAYRPVLMGIQANHAHLDNALLWHIATFLGGNDITEKWFESIIQ